MQARFLVENPEAVQFTMKLTMTAKEWEELRDQLINQWPSAQLTSAITSALASVRKVHYSEQEALR